MCREGDAVLEQGFYLQSKRLILPTVMIVWEDSGFQVRCCGGSPKGRGAAGCRTDTLLYPPSFEWEPHLPGSLCPRKNGKDGKCPLMRKIDFIRRQGK